MNPLKRDNNSVRATDHENRIQALERRIFGNDFPWAQVTLTTPQTIGAGSAEFIGWDHLNRNPSQPDSFRTTTNTPGDTTLLADGALFGVFLALTQVRWENAAAYPHSSILNVGRQLGTVMSDTVPNTLSTSDTLFTGSSIFATGDISFGVHTAWDYLATQPAFWSLQVNNGDVVDRDVLAASLTVVYLETSEEAEDYAVY